MVRVTWRRDSGNSRVVSLQHHRRFDPDDPEVVKVFTQVVSDNALRVIVSEDDEGTCILNLRTSMLSTASGAEVDAPTALQYLSGTLAGRICLTLCKAEQAVHEAQAPANLEKPLRPR
jgi:hypothetical protein